MTPNDIRETIARLRDGFNDIPLTAEAAAEALSALLPIVEELADTDDADWIEWSPLIKRAREALK